MYSAPGTRSFQMFEPLPKECTAAKGYSSDNNIAITHDLDGKPIVLPEISNFDFVGCIYKD